MTAIYQSARPATFAEVVGQDHVKDILVAALRRGRASHAYLFSGPRGVGKTTTARLLAMALNCEADEAVQRPCGSCDGCRMVRDGAHPDVIELDAASNNSVDDVRDLRERTNLASMRGGSRVWILDEAHMLSRAAANALLKTLEEPPQGLVFVLATTEPEKLPPTVLSRCQHFRFRRLSEAEIMGKLERLCREAGAEAEQEALALVARAADGAMRDGESLLERLLTPGTAITRRAAEEALGLPPVERIQRLAQALATGDLATLLLESEALYRDGFAPRSLAERLGITLRDALRADVLGSVPEDAFRVPLQRDDLLRLIHALDDEQERFVRRDDLYSLEVALIKGVNAVRGGASPASASGAAVEAEQAELPAFEPTARGARVTPAKAKHVAGGSARPRSGVASRTADELTDANSGANSGAPKEASPGAGRASEGAEGKEPQGEGAGARKALDWHAVRSAAGPQLKAFLMPARESVAGNEVTIRYAEMHKFHFNELKKREGELAGLIEQIGGPGYSLRIEGPGEHSAKKS